LPGSGGVGCRPFYLTEVDRLESRHRSQLPDTSYTDEEIEAGFKKVGDAFGFMGVLDYMGKETRVEETKLLKWTVYEFHQRQSLYAWRADCLRRYSEMQNDKSNRR
jgi:hypothetical protein